MKTITCNIVANSDPKPNNMTRIKDEDDNDNDDEDDDKNVW